MYTTGINIDKAMPHNGRPVCQTYDCPRLVFNIAVHNRESRTSFVTAVKAAMITKSNAYHQFGTSGYDRMSFA